MNKSPGKRFREAVEYENPLQIVGTINAFCAKLAERAGYRAIYLSGAGVANASHGLPDLGATSLADVLEDARRIISSTELPLLVDCDTGWGSSLSIYRAIREMIRAGVAAVHLEDQIDSKRCGHRPGKRLVTTATMSDRIKAAVDAKSDRTFVIMARTDAAAVEGLETAIERSLAYVQAGADMIFAEALQDTHQWKQFTDALPVPVLANMTEFGKSPLLSVDELRAVGIRIALYPLTAFRAMSFAAQNAYHVLRAHGTQKSLLPHLQTREELYDVLDYLAWERALDEQLSDTSDNRPKDQP